MVQAKPHFIFFTCLTSGIAAILSLVGLATEQWVISSGQFKTYGENQQFNNIKYGLFSGVFQQKLSGQPVAFQITMTCLYGKNSCALLCKNTEEERIQELNKLLHNEDVFFDYNCPKVSKMLKPVFIDFKSKDRENSGRSLIFISAASYLSTLFFLSASIASGLFSVFLASWNTGGHPPYKYLRVRGLYISNLSAAVFILLMIIIWGVEFTVKLFNNIAILYTIIGQMETTGQSMLGFSYWINIGSFFLYLTSILLLWMRKYVVEHENGDKEGEELHESNNLMNRR